ncbi:MAG: hypothetical protein ABIQ88_00840 [Chitinophagaceae bacterium]
MEKISKLSLAVNFDNPPREEIALVGFLFYCNGLLLQRQLVRKNILEFNLADKTRDVSLPQDVNPADLRVFIAPATDRKIEQVTSIEELESYKPYEPVLTTDGQGVFSILPVPSSIAQFWPFCNCRVTGKVSKWFHTGGSWADRAVCRARVHICEIDPIRYWIYRIPDTIIAKIPDIILRPREVIKVPIPIPDPAPFLQVAGQQAVPQQPAVFKTVSAEQLQMKAAGKLPEISLDIRQNLASGNLNLVRETILNNYTLLHPWFCLWPWWWHYFYRCTERKIVYTDASGRFDTNISYQCFGDKPDIYLWVEYNIDGVWTTVYKPPTPCYTYWDYACGTNINIHITDPRVPGDCCCNCPLPGEMIWIRGVGGNGDDGGTSVRRINQLSYMQAPPGQSVSYQRLGLTDAAAGGDDFLITTAGDYKRPFGGTLSFYMGFGDGLPNTNIYHYRWRYKRLTDALLNTISSPVETLKGVEMKKYDFIFTDSNGIDQFGHNTVKLGPFTVGPSNDLFIIPPAVPNQAPFSVPERSPQWIERTRSMQTVSIDSSSLISGGDGLYEFVLELFDKAGNLLTNLPQTTFRVPDMADPGTSVVAPTDLLLNPTGSAAGGYKMLMRIDNGHCNAQIFPVKVNSLDTSTDCCGFVHYKPEGTEADLALSFLATHTNNFAVFNFGAVRGTCGGVAGTGGGGMVIDSASGYTLSSGIYEKHFTPAQLLESCYAAGAGKAAFAESLSVISMSTNGASRVRNDAGDLAAFALEP